MKQLFQFDQDHIRDQIKTAARSNEHVGHVAESTHKALVRNPLCGDEVEVTVRLDSEGRVQDLKANLRGCLVARAAWSLLAPNLKSLTRSEALEVLNLFETELRNENEAPVYTALPTPLSSLLAYRLPSPRHSCATLGSQALLQALQPENCNQ